MKKTQKTKKKKTLMECTKGKNKINNKTTSFLLTIHPHTKANVLKKVKKRNKQKKLDNICQCLRGGQWGKKKKMRSTTINKPTGG